MILRIKFIASIFLTFFLLGCSPQVQTIVQKEIEYRDRIKEVVTTDSVRDSIYIRVSGDTVFQFRDRWHTRTHKETDTLTLKEFIEKPYPVKVPVEVERKFTLWERVRLDTWAWTLSALLACVAWIFRKPLLKLLRMFLSRLLI